MRYLLMTINKIIFPVVVLAILLPRGAFPQPQTINVSIADQSTTATTSQLGKPAEPEAQEMKGLKEPDVMYCPKPEELVRKGLWWGLGGNWKSYSQSFVKKLTTFVSVQWVGIKVGNVICVYTGPGELSFPVQIQYGLLIDEPVGGLWQKNLGGYKNCFSSNIYDCPFKKMAKPQPVNIGKELEDLKKTKPSGVFESGF